MLPVCSGTEHFDQAPVSNRAVCTGVAASRNATQHRGRSAGVVPNLTVHRDKERACRCTRTGEIPPSIRGMFPNRRGSQKVGQCKWLSQGTLLPPGGGNSFSRAVAVLLLLSRWCIYFKCFRSLEVGKLRQHCHLLLSDSSTSCDLHWGVQIDLLSLPFGSDESRDTDVSQLSLLPPLYCDFKPEYLAPLMKNTNLPVFVWQVAPTIKWNKREWQQIGNNSD